MMIIIDHHRTSRALCLFAIGQKAFNPLVINGYHDTVIYNDCL